MSTSDLILVTGATGKIGSCIASFLERSGNQLRLLARDPNKLSNFPNAQKGKGDYADVQSLDRGFAGVSSAFIVSGYAEPGERARLHRNAFQAAQRAGVGHLIYLSTLGASPNSRFPMSRDHYESEQFLKATGIPYTILQDSFYCELAVQMFDEDGVMKGPGGQGKVSWVGREEIAEAAAKLLASNEPLLGTLPMTGPSALSLTETAAMISSVKHRPLRYEDEPLHAAREWRSKLGVPAWEVETWVGSYDAIAAGEFEVVDPSLAEILGRPVSDLKNYLSARPSL
ncbi:MAG TPA: SDR family oxidoreductase [Acidobacteriaceae bacterium]|nr:SDR family oxidoreductase [Acidobacteriaceae bacterium]